jgi:hypothetical protein
MKTTIEISDELLTLAKREALARRTTLKALLEDGLRHTLAQEPAARGPQAPFRLPVIRGALTAGADANEDANALIDAMREEASGAAIAGRTKP